MIPQTENSLISLISKGFFHPFGCLALRGVFLLGFMLIFSITPAIAATDTNAGVGPQGPAGPAGPQGPIGLTGPAGPAGKNGTNGATGPAGPAGKNGTNGATGPAGKNGTNGATGPAGPAGPQGPIGLTGPAGPAGKNGTNGTTGPVGPIGPQGPIGLTGPQGVTGSQGPSGVFDITSSSNQSALVSFATNQSFRTALTKNLGLAGTNVAIGYQSGLANQGLNAVAIGRGAGLNNQAPNSIVLNASGVELDGTNSGFYVNPIRSDASTGVGLFYNTITREISYGIAPVGLTPSSITSPSIASALAGSSIFVNALAGNSSFTGNANLLSGLASGLALNPSLLSLLSSTLANDNPFARTLAKNTYFTAYPDLGAGLAANASLASGLASNSSLVLRLAGNTSFLSTLSGNLGLSDSYVAIGMQAGLTNQGSNSVAIGYQAGLYSQSAEAVAIGDNAGNSNQGQSAIAIGQYAGLSNQAANSIVLNASGLELDAANSGFYVNPIRAAASSTALYYNPETGEITCLASDRRLKRNIQPVTNALGTLMELNPVTYEMKYKLSDTNYPMRDTGFIAQELRKVLPDLVSEKPGKEKILNVNLTPLIPILTKAVQQQQVEIEKQQKEINELKASLRKLMNQKTPEIR